MGQFVAGGESAEVSATEWAAVLYLAAWVLVIVLLTGTWRF